MSVPGSCKRSCVDEICQIHEVLPRDPRFLRFYARAFFTHDFKNRSAENIFRSGALRRFLKIGARTANDELARRVDLAPESARREAAR